MVTRILSFFKWMSILGIHLIVAYILAAIVYALGIVIASLFI